MEARLVAEIEGKAGESRSPKTCSPRPRTRTSPRLIARQKLTFMARRRYLDSEVETLERGLQALRENVTGNEVQITAAHEQIAFFEEELADKEALLAKGLVRRPEVLALQRARSNMRGEIGRLVGDMGDAKERIARGLEQINALAPRRREGGGRGATSRCTPR